MGGQESRLVPLVSHPAMTDEQVLSAIMAQSWTSDDLNGCWVEGRSPLHAAVEARRGGVVVAALVDKGADVNRTYSRHLFVTSIASTLLTAGAIVYLTTLIYVLGTLTTALLISHSECHSLWWLAWFGVWLVAPLSRLGRDGANGGALLLYWDLAIFVSYWLLYAPLWTTLVCVVIAGLSSFYLLLSLTEAASAGELYFRSEAQGWTPLHMACYFGDEAVVRVLVSKRANARATDRKNRRPIDVVPPDRQEAIAHALGAS